MALLAPARPLRRNVWLLLRRARQAAFNQLDEARPGNRLRSFSSSCFSSDGDMVMPTFFSYSALLVATSARNSVPGAALLPPAWLFGSLVPSGRKPAPNDGPFWNPGTFGAA